MSRRKIVLAGKQYGIGEAKEKCKRILHDADLHEILLGYEFEVMVDLYRHHPEWPDLAENIDAIKVGITTHASGNRHRAFHIQLIGKNGFDEKPSYLKCFNPSEETLASKVNEAMRQAIHGDVSECRSKANSKEPGHVHHDGKPFVEIRNEWLSENGGIDSISIVRNSEGLTFEMADQSQAISWIAFHRKHARLVFMTPEQHSMHHYNRKDGFSMEERFDEQRKELVRSGNESMFKSADRCGRE